MEEIIHYQPDKDVRLEVKTDGETVWLNANQIAELFERDSKTIRKHINNALREELEGLAVVAKFATTTQHGAMDGKVQTHEVNYYNLDVIISVGFRVKSKRGVQFRQWANRVLKERLLTGYANRLLENRIEKLEAYIEEIITDQNDINDDTRMQLELINQTLAELQVKQQERKERKPIVGFRN